MRSPLSRRYVEDQTRLHGYAGIAARAFLIPQLEKQRPSAGVPVYLDGCLFQAREETNEMCASIHRAIEKILGPLRRDDRIALRQRPQTSEGNPRSQARVLPAPISARRRSARLLFTEEPLRRMGFHQDASPVCSDRTKRRILILRRLNDEPLQRLQSVGST